MPWLPPILPWLPPILIQVVQALVQVLVLQALGRWHSPTCRKDRNQPKAE
jgi:hypothetical protein